MTVFSCLTPHKLGCIPDGPVSLWGEDMPKHSPQSTTHFACQERLTKHGSKTTCCGCDKHKCKEISKAPKDKMLRNTDAKQKLCPQS